MDPKRYWSEIAADFRVFLIFVGDAVDDGDAAQARKYWNLYTRHLVELNDHGQHIYYQKFTDVEHRS